MMPALLTSTLADRLGVGDVGLVGDGLAAGRLDLADQVLGRLGLAGIVEDDGEAVAGQAFRHRPADAARGAGDDRYLVALVGHFVSPGRHRVGCESTMSL
jgi:hypothetical protein